MAERTAQHSTVYDMFIDDKRISISLATVEFRAVGAGTNALMDSLVEAVQRAG